MKNEMVFKLKRMFDPDNILSIWVLKLSLIRNDLFYVHRSLIDYLSGTKIATSGEYLYYFRLAASHYREAAKYVEKWNKDNDVISFVSELPVEHREEYRLILDSCTPWETSFVNRILKPIRDNFFHYDISSFQKDYRKLDDIFTRIVSSGDARNETDFVFADELSINLIFGNNSKQEIEEILSELSTYMSALISFVDAAIGTYLYNNKSKQAYMIRTKN